ncbi:MAG TPA: hypothetical protein VGQ41_14605 [Pyrinomonadaceae bacterium]|nr:hypothetical protein [Pyrinomonadaceae bacterium]
MRKSFSKFLGPLSKPLSQTLNTAQIISRSPSHSLRLLVNSWSAPRIQAQPDVYPFAAYLAERYDCTHVVAIGRPSAKDLIHLYPRFEIIGIVPSADLQTYRSRYGFATWLEENTNLTETLSLPDTVLRRAIIVSDRLDHFLSPESLLKNLKTQLVQAPVCVLTDRGLDRADGNGTLIDLEHILKSEGFHLEFIGWTASDNVTYEKKTLLAVITNDAVAMQVRAKAPADFRVVAFMAAYNEEDIIVQSIKKWTDQGISVHVLENWSTDATYDLVTDLATRLPVTVERFPEDGPSKYFDWGAMLARMETLSREIAADWFIRRGADEVLVSPWPGVSYKDALYLVDQAGFNCVDHTIVEFHPVDDGFEMGMDHEAYFKHFDFQNLSHSNQRKAWKNCGQPISTIASAGHDVLFDGRKVYPFKFLLKHYSFRSQQHGEKKVFRERKARWNPKERARGWHIHYDSMKEGHRFVQSATEKAIFEEDQFNKTYLVERLSSIGTRRK